MKAYKVFDSNWKCKGFQYEVGKEYKIDCEPVMYKRGFHACKKLNNCFSYYPFDANNKVAEVELLGTTIIGTILGTYEERQVTNHIKIVKELSWHEVLDLVNTGYKNTGINNTGDMNAGSCNTGDCNTGNCNTGAGNAGHSNVGWRNIGNNNTGNNNVGSVNTGSANKGNWNTGSWNTCNNETGYFNTEQSKTIRVFNKPCDLEEWKKIDKPEFLYFNLEGVSYDKCFKKAYLEAKEMDDWEEQKQLLLNLPNFDKDVFKTASGIDIDED